MRNKQVIISIAELNGGALESQTIRTFEEEYQAKDFIENKLKDALANARETSGDLEILPVDGNIRDMWNSAPEGSFSYAIGGRGYKVSYLKIPAEYSVSDKETVTVLDAFVNSSRTVADYKRVAESISQDMHRHCQNELWKFVKQVIRAFSMGHSDERNAVAHEEAGAVHGYVTMYL